VRKIGYSVRKGDALAAIAGAAFRLNISDIRWLGMT